MSTRVTVRKHILQVLNEWICSSGWFQNFFALGLFGGGGFTLLGGLIGLVAWVVVVITQITNNRMELSGFGWLFAATALFLLAFDAAFTPVTFEGGSDYGTQRGLNWILGMSFICLLVTGVGAYLVLSGSAWALAAVLVVPIFNLVFFVVTFIAVVRGI